MSGEPQLDLVDAVRAEGGRGTCAVTRVDQQTLLAAPRHRHCATETSAWAIASVASSALTAAASSRPPPGGRG